jgi:hypothetical protein
MLIRQYLNVSLRPLLRVLGLSSSAQGLICEDVRHRLGSILGNWGDESFRRTALLLGAEEAIFYEPSLAPLEVRAMVVIAIRNSMIEDISASRPFVPALRRFAESMPALFVPTITKEAISFFSRLPFSDAGWGVTCPRSEDLFRGFSQQFPMAWRRLEMLATTERQELYSRAF